MELQLYSRDLLIMQSVDYLNVLCMNAQIKGYFNKDVILNFMYSSLFIRSGY